MMEKSLPILNIAATCQATHVLGPGLRSAVWVQGCPFTCKGCISPEWRIKKTAIQITSENLANELLSNPDVTGITISGGEPFHQAEGLSRMLSIIRSRRNVDVICFSGYTFEELIKDADRHNFQKLLRRIDLLIDGKYEKNLDDGIGLRGSQNQKFIFLNERLKNYDFIKIKRSVELHIQNGQILEVGIPRMEIKEALDFALENIHRFYVEVK
jgi:anaerobic ribonucleoside-triphosphate reductase activating protein